MDKQSVAEAAEFLADAQEYFDSVDAEYEALRSKRCDALNALSAAQKEFDAAVVAIRKNAPWDSAWSERSGLKAA